ncbi:MAG: hypothetical protein WCT32_02070 [Patescibacteria group bacterium]|jgi:hypothetical protein
MTKEEEWGQKAEAWGKKVEKEWETRGDEIGKRIEKPAEYIFTIIASIILLWIYGRLEGWLPFVTDSFSATLTLFYISSIATIVANIIFLLIDSSTLRAALKALLNIWSIVVMISTCYIFPFDFSAYSFNWTLLVRILIILGIVGTAIGTFTELAKAMGKIREKCQ